jgi:hypothetical protein
MVGDSLTARLCAAGMAVDGDSAAAQPLFQQAWDARRDAYDAALAAHFLARHQPTAELTLHWNQIAIAEACRVADDRAQPLFASLYLNLADSYFNTGNTAEATASAVRGVEALAHLPLGGYRDFVAGGLARLRARTRNATARGST